MAEALLKVVDVGRSFSAGEQELTVLNNVNLEIHRGEMIAIIGASGSGKSTLMNILGCLDKPTKGSYFINGQDTSKMEDDELAALRREYFGFIFQRYHLLSDLSALGNVEVPALYANEGPHTRAEKATKLLTRLGLEDRLDHKPNQLSGGQQQRVSVARALVNGGDVILADEPTGALDSSSGEEMMKLLRELHLDGHTIILVTHDPNIAEFADRVIEIKDGEIISDHLNPSASEERPLIPERSDVEDKKQQATSRLNFSRYLEAFKMATIAMSHNRLRTFLTMLGIIIGIASVVSVVALGAGSQQSIMDQIASMGTNTIEIKPGTGRGDRRSGRVRTLTAGDANALKTLSFIDSVTPTVRANVAIRYSSETVTGSVQGVGTEYFRVRGYTLAQGQYFDEASVEALEQVAIIDENTEQELFSDGNAVGSVIFLGRLPVRVIGVTDPIESVADNSDELNVWLPYTTVSGRIFRQNYVSDITVRVDENVSSEVAEQGIISLLTMRHGVVDFFTINTDTIRKSIEKTSETMTLLISAIAFISLLVGGIGVMNIMLVSVTERTGEIGIRVAVGARQADIMRQFLIEAVLVCFCGGILGIALAYLVGVVITYTGSDYQMIYSTASIVAAFVCSTLIGIIFGYFPARNAARLNPIEALSRD
ncbi:MacB family efflux pump subunit [Neptuniibacter sp. 2_MG-2023]|jgi:macrolide transport system ATP-binding/permease protein|uniref:MacB family efflux pump subunit n=1 Tax=Neptuniibacter sp. 2_MG-2023 TaxID=3062671 RepID=UPI0026E43C36|nr:MacB family efflux pump subunit [Neptuniibacter sp. 2_MG-2023]MDO6512946.1 MacB family efflux pump subunit [Neptuniibacter sp. 2_MG-2023]